MAKLNRYTQIIFGSTSGSNQIAQFGSLAASAPAYSLVPGTIMALSQWAAGWFAAVLGGNSPAIEDMNAAFYVITYQLAALFQNGIAPWDSGTTYYAGSIVQDGNGNQLVSLQDTNLNHALTDSSWWRGSGGQVRTVSSVETATAADSILLCDPTGGSFIETLPTLASCFNGQRFTIKNIGAGANTVTPKGNGSEVIDFANSYQALNSGESATIMKNASQWWVI